jgi:hypothetical protein
MIVGEMKDENLKMRNLHVSYTLGYSRNWEKFPSVMGECVI